MKNKKDIICSFCGKDANNVEVMITGVTGNICAECVALAEEVLFEKRVKNIVKRLLKERR